MATELRDGYDGIIEGSGPESFCTKSPTSDFPRLLADPGPTTPADNGRSLKLLGRLREAQGTRHYSRRTENTYCQSVKRFIFFHNVRHPADHVP
jgi:hypothetical protein